MKTKHLGKNNSKIPTGFKILDPIERNKVSNSYGVDFWNAYEFSYLDSNKQPTLKVLEIKLIKLIKIFMHLFKKELLMQLQLEKLNPKLVHLLLFINLQEKLRF